MDKQELLDAIRECEKSSPDKLCALRAENERLKRDVEHYAQAILWEGDMIVTQTRYEQVQARIAELEADVVWAVRHAATCTVEPAESLYGHPSIEVPCNGTPADILRAVREARNGVS